MGHMIGGRVNKVSKDKIDQAMHRILKAWVQEDMKRKNGKVKNKSMEAKQRSQEIMKSLEDIRIGGRSMKAGVVILRTELQSVMQSLKDELEKAKESKDANA